MEFWKNRNLEKYIFGKWEFEKMESWKNGKLEKLEIWKNGNLEKMKFGKMEIWKNGNLEKKEI